MHENPLNDQVIQDALERAYVFMLLSESPYRHTLNGQSDLCAVRDALAMVRQEDIEETQCEFEARAVLGAVNNWRRRNPMSQDTLKTLITEIYDISGACLHARLESDRARKVMESYERDLKEIVSKLRKIESEAWMAEDTIEKVCKGCGRDIENKYSRNGYCIFCDDNRIIT